MVVSTVCDSTALAAAPTQAARQADGEVDFSAALLQAGADSGVGMVQPVPLPASPGVAVQPTADVGPPPLNTQSLQLTPAAHADIPVKQRHDAPLEGHTADLHADAPEPVTPESSLVQQLSRDIPTIGPIPSRPATGTPAPKQSASAKAEQSSVNGIDLATLAAPAVASNRTEAQAEIAVALPSPQPTVTDAKNSEHREKQAVLAPATAMKEEAVQGKKTEAAEQTGTVPAVEQAPALPSLVSASLALDVAPQSTPAPSADAQTAAPPVPVPSEPPVRVSGIQNTATFIHEVSAEPSTRAREVRSARTSVTPALRGKTSSALEGRDVAAVKQEPLTAATATPVTTPGSQPVAQKAQSTPTPTDTGNPLALVDDGQAQATSIAGSPKEPVMKGSRKSESVVGAHSAFADVQPATAPPDLGSAATASAHASAAHASAAAVPSLLGPASATGLPAASGIAVTPETLSSAFAFEASISNRGTSVPHLETTGIGTGLRSEVLQLHATSEPASRTAALEVGFHDGTLGWLSVRATADVAGGLHASVGARTPGAAAAVESMLPALGRFLQESNVGLHTVSSAALTESVASATSPLTPSSPVHTAGSGGAGGLGAQAGGGSPGSSPHEQQGSRNGSTRTPAHTFAAESTEGRAPTMDGPSPIRYAGTERISSVSVRI